MIGAATLCISEVTSGGIHLYENLHFDTQRLIRDTDTMERKRKRQLKGKLVPKPPDLFIKSRAKVIGIASTTEIPHAESSDKKRLLFSFWYRRIITPPEISIVAATIESESMVENTENSPYSVRERRRVKMGVKRNAAPLQKRFVSVKNKDERAGTFSLFNLSFIIAPRSALPFTVSFIIFSRFA